VNSHETNREGRRIVEAELLRRGAGSVISDGTQKVLLHATGSDGNRTVIIKVKAKRKENWHSTAGEGKSVEVVPENEDNFWVFVDVEGAPKFWVVPDWWIRNDIYEKHEQYLKEHGGHRPVNDDSDHHRIEESRLEEWQDKWEILKIF
jgi:hypothetical protein